MSIILNEELLMKCNKEIFLVWMEYFANDQDIIGFRLFKADPSTKAWAASNCKSAIV